MAWPTDSVLASCRKRCARLEKTFDRSGRRSRGIVRCAKASICAGSRIRCMSHFAKPGAMMLPGPTRCHRTPGHGVHRSFHPDGSIDVNDDRTDQYPGAYRMHHRAKANQPDGNVSREVYAPDDDTG